MNEQDLLYRILFWVTSLLVLGESLALTYGMFIFLEGQSQWVTKRNTIYLALDLLVGLGLVVWGIFHAHLPQGFLWGLLALGAVLHAVRLPDYPLGMPEAFAFNGGLFLVLLLRFGGLSALILLRLLPPR